MYVVSVKVDGFSPGIVSFTMERARIWDKNLGVQYRLFKARTDLSFVDFFWEICNENTRFEAL